MLEQPTLEAALSAATYSAILMMTLMTPLSLKLGLLSWSRISVRPLLMIRWLGSSWTITKVANVSNYKQDMAIYVQVGVMVLMTSYMKICYLDIATWQLSGEMILILTADKYSLFLLSHFRLYSPVVCKHSQTLIHKNMCTSFLITSILLFDTLTSIFDNKRKPYFSFILCMFFLQIISGHAFCS